MKTVFDDQWFALIRSGRWRGCARELVDFIDHAPLAMHWKQLDDLGQSALHHLLTQSTTVESFDDAWPLLEALSRHDLSPWDHDSHGQQPYWWLVENQACKEVLVWCWTRTQEPGHSERSLCDRTAFDRLSWVLRTSRFPGSPEQNRLRALHGLPLNGLWADGSTTLSRLLAAAPLPSEVESPGQVFQGLASLMGEAAALPPFSDGAALLGVWVAHAHVMPAPGSLAVLFHQWVVGWCEKRHGAGEGVSDSWDWAWADWCQWLGERSRSPVWAGYGALAACWFAQARADAGDLKGALTRLLEGMVKSARLLRLRDSPGELAWPVFAWEKAWALWLEWTARSTDEVPDELVALVVPLLDHPSVQAWLRERRGWDPSFSALPEDWREAWEADRVTAWESTPTVLP